VVWDDSLACDNDGSKTSQSLFDWGLCVAWSPSIFGLHRHSPLTMVKTSPDNCSSLQRPLQSDWHLLMWPLSWKTSLGVPPSSDSTSRVNYSSTRSLSLPLYNSRKMKSNYFRYILTTQSLSVQLCFRIAWKWLNLKYKFEIFWWFFLCKWSVTVRAPVFNSCLNLTLSSYTLISCSF